MLESQRGHRIVSHACAKYAERAVYRRMGVAPDDDLSWRPEAIFDDHVMKASAPSLEHITDSVFRGEPADFKQFLGSLPRGR